MQVFFAWVTFDDAWCVRFVDATVELALDSRAPTTEADVDAQIPPQFEMLELYNILEGPVVDEGYSVVIEIQVDELWVFAELIVRDDCDEVVVEGDRFDVL